MSEVLSIQRVVVSVFGSFPLFKRKKREKIHHQNSRESQQIKNNTRDTRSKESYEFEKMIGPPRKGGSDEEVEALMQYKFGTQNDAFGAGKSYTHDDFFEDMQFYYDNFSKVARSRTKM